ncbi:MAG: hypothetical protein HYR84_12675 [Planctomycetes bacterium]|nr:hypothetical protein [Planctomycetota bacterium]
MSHFADLAHQSMVASGEHVRAIGWLHPAHPYSKGDVSATFMSRLKQFAAESADSAESLFFGAFCGIHTCEFCGKAHGVANFGVPCDTLLYIAPEMIVHYIEEHGYCPPQEFVAAVLRSPLPDTDEGRKGVGSRCFCVIS